MMRAPAVMPVPAIPRPTTKLLAMIAPTAGNTVVEGCRTRSVFTPQDPATAQWISDVLGPKTEVTQTATFTGARMSPWLGHVMVGDQATSRPLMDAAEICKLSAKEMILLVAGFRPIRARRFKYYKHPEFAERARLPRLKLKPGGPYPYRPRQHPNPWAGRTSPQPPGADVTDTAPQPDPPLPTPASTADGSDRTDLDLALPASEADPKIAMEATPVPVKETVDAIQEQLDLLASDEDRRRLQALDEFERLGATRHHKIRPNIPL